MKNTNFFISLFLLFAFASTAWVTDDHRRPLPTMEVMMRRSLTAAQGEPDQPRDREHQRDDPQQMHSEACAEQDENEK
jgi:hypothetical protein